MFFKLGGGRECEDLGSSSTVRCSLDTAVSVGLGGIFLFKKHSCNSTTSKAPYNSDVLKALIQVASTFFSVMGTLSPWEVKGDC